jgi:hypothetical protein
LAEDREKGRKQKEAEQQQKLKEAWWENKWWENKASTEGEKEENGEDEDVLTREIQAILRYDQRGSPQKHVDIALSGQRVESVDVFDLQWGMLRYYQTWNREEISLVMSKPC